MNKALYQKEFWVYTLDYWHAFVVVPHNPLQEQFKEAAPVRPQFGLKMLQKMGWSPGEGLGKNKEGTTEPLLLDVKMDKKGTIHTLCVLIA